MKTFSINKLSNEDITKAYQFIYFFEKEIYSKYGTFDFDNPKITSFSNENKINKKVRRNTKPTENYFWFDTKKIKGADKNDYTHNFLRHIRNAFAHGNFKKERNKKAFYIFEDYNNNKELTMYGKINANLFWDYLNILLHTSPLIANNINF